MQDFDEICCADALWDPGGGLVIKTITGSRNEPPTAAILNFVIREYLGRGSKYLHQIWYVSKKLVPEAHE